MEDTVQNETENEESATTTEDATPETQVAEEPTTPIEPTDEEEAVNEPVDTDTEEKKTEVQPETSTAETVASTEDATQRSDSLAPSCPVCVKTPGLQDENTLCSNCQGTGKVHASAAAFPDGTQVLRPEGTFNVVNGVEVKQE